MYFDILQRIGIRPEDVIEYLRKSRTDDPLLSVEEVLKNHEKIIDDWCKTNFGELIPEENRFREVVSGETIDDRPEVQKVLKMVESPRYKAIMVVEVQRLSRGDLEDAGRLIKLLRYSNTIVITPVKIYDLRDEYDRDAFERELKRGNEYLEYTKKILNRGMLLSVSSGNYVGSVAPYGYDRTTVMDGNRKCPTLKPNPETAPIVQMVFDMYANKGMGATLICHELNKMGIKSPQGKRWQRYAIFSMLENIHYLGKVRWNWRKTVKSISDQELVESRPKAKIGEYLIFEGKHDAIISEELFNKAAQVRGSKPRTRNDTTVKNPVAGLMYCSCGWRMGMNTYVNRGVKFADAKIVCRNQVNCKCGSVVLHEVIDEVKKALRECIADFEVRIENEDDTSAAFHESLIKSLKQKMKDIEKKELEQWELRSSGEMPKPIFDKLNEKLLKEKAEIQQALCNAYESVPEPVNYKERLATFREALAALEDDSVSGEAKNMYMKQVIERIDFKRKPAVRLNKKNAKEFGYVKLPAGMVWYEYPYEMHITIKN